MSRLKQLENDATMICDMYRPVKTLPRAIKRSLERLVFALLFVGKKENFEVNDPLFIFIAAIKFFGH